MRLHAQVIYVLLCVCVYALILILAEEPPQEINDDEISPGLVRRGKKGGGDKMDKCAKQWKVDELPGRCFGIGPYHEMFIELKDKKIKSARMCKRACCRLGPKCITWQYGGGAKNDECRLGGPVRLGFEGSGVSGWCEPNAPRTWMGYSVSREGGRCSVDKELPGQCFGLGAERMNHKDQRLSPMECEAACCADASCKVWQALPDRGCFYHDGIAHEIAYGSTCMADDHAVLDWCDPTVEAYVGGRKCAVGFCTGDEDKYDAVIYSGKLD